MEFKGTKGDWEIYGISDDLIEIYSVENKKPIFDIHPHTKKSESNANAKLIACAPEMLEMLAELKNRFEHFNDKVSVFDIEALIKKATTI